MALAFVPVDQLDEAFEQLVQNMPEETREQLESVLDSLEDNYIGRPLRHGRGRRTPKYPPAIW